MPARIKKIRHDEETRAKIQTSQIINRLMGHLNGDHELSATQVSVGLGLLRKTLPDLQATTVRGDGEDGAIKMIITGVPRAADG